MGKPYSSKKSFISNMIISYMNLYDNFPENDDVFMTFHNEVMNNLDFLVFDKNDLSHLNYEIITVDDDPNNIKVLTMNLITSLWFIGIIPHSGVLVEKIGKFDYKGIRYTFNETDLKLEINKIIYEN